MTLHRRFPTLTAAALYALAEEAAERGMGLLLDFVPNHVGLANGENPWWWDVMRYGQRSPLASYFDIDWEAQPAFLATLRGSLP